ncbi:MAG: iron ABC transporter permease [Candidatus Omnitrophica bacterium]|nr:iron ABC transporter permease [Candidatus Omnitrophota bacterium]
MEQGTTTRLTAARVIVIMSILMFLSLAVIFGALHCGVLKIGTRDIVSCLIEKMTQPDVPHVEARISLIVWDIRLKRIMLAFVVGMALAVSGCIFQALLRNSLADPHILGTSSGGALGAVLATACGIPIFLQNIITVPFFSFAGSLGAMGLVYALSKRKGELSVYSLLLVGVILNSFFISIVIFIETIVSHDQLTSIFFWLLGSLSNVNGTLIVVVSVAVCASVTVLFSQTRNINLLTLGDEKARQLGVSTERTKAICFIGASFITGLSVAVSGLIGFVGLVVPHIVRLLFGPDHRLSLPASALVGGMFLVIADTIARTILMPQELPVGVVTSFIGAPFFIFLLKKKETRRIV